ncbi:MAG: hypothetical protein R2792_02820 [Saprospiraceae bacterium]
MKSLDFKALKDLVKIVNKNKIKQLEILGVTQFEDSKSEILYEGILRDTFNSDDEAAEAIFGSFSKDPKYKKLRAKFFRQLVNTVFFIDFNESMFTEQSRAISNCYKDFAAAQLLQGRGAKVAAAFLLQQTLTQTDKLELTDLNSEIARTIVSNYGSTITDLTGFGKYLELYRKYEKERAAEMKAFLYYKELDMYYASSNSPNDEVFQKASAYYEELQAMEGEISTIRFLFHLFLIGMIKNSSGGTHHESLQLIESTLDNLKDRPSFTRGQHQSILLQKLFCIAQLKLKSPDNQEEVFQHYFTLAREGDYPWFKGYEVKCFYYIGIQAYEEALDAYLYACQQSNYQRLTGMTHDNFHLLLGYFYLLGELGVLDKDKIVNVCGEFKLGGYMNKFDVVEKDREGMNIPIMLLPILFDIVNPKEYGEKGRSGDALDKYRQRYLENDLNKRSACFLKLLLALINHPFDEANSEKKIQKELDILLDLKPDVNRQVYFIEVIPYEHLWEMLYKHVTGK